MARVSLSFLALAALGGPSCLITSSPDFAKPTRTPPFLTGLIPAPYAVTTVRAVTTGMYPTQQAEFTVVSEDLQSPPLQAVLVRDFEGLMAPFKERLWFNFGIPAGHLNNPSAPARDPIKLDFTFGPGIAPGCHSATLVVSHAFDFNDLLVNRLSPKDEGDIATAVWWYELVDPTNPQPGCGIDITPTGDAGTDAGAGAP